MSTNRCFSQIKTSSPCIAVCNLNLTEDHLITFTNHSRYNPNSLNRSTAIIGLTQEGDKGMFQNQIHHQEAALLFTFFFSNSIHNFLFLYLKEDFSYHEINDVIQLPVTDERVNQVLLKWAGHKSCEGQY